VGEVEGGVSWLIGSTIDVRFTCSPLAPSSSRAGGHCDDPARSCFLEVARRVDGYPDTASFCADLRQQEKGRRARELAGPTRPFRRGCSAPLRRRVHAAAIAAALVVFGGLFRTSAS
jgi:hypothetical protein